MKVALIHDDFTQLGGAERLFEQIAKIFPDAPIYSSLANFDKLPRSINRKRLRISFMQKMPFSRKFYKLFLPFYPFAFESFNFDQFDLVISSTTRFAKSIVTNPKTVHICYINSVPRFLYEGDKKNDYLPSTVKILISPYLGWLRRWDLATSSRPDYYIANSNNVQKKVNKYYNRESNLVYPCTDTDFFKPTQSKKPGDFYLIVTRLVKWKKVEIAIKAAVQLGLSLVIVGTGSDQHRLTRKSNKQIQFQPSVTREELRTLYQNAKALIVTQDEDFGMAAVEAQACGIPVIAYSGGGVSEIIVHKQTGFLFDEQSSFSLKDAITTSSRLKYDSRQIRKNALRFTKQIFEKSLKETLETYVNPA